MSEQRKSSWFDWSFLALGLVIQLVTFFLANTLSMEGTGAGLLSLISGCLGVCSVCLCAQGSIWTYIFGFGQVITYTWLCLQAHLYGAVAINVYYFLTMIYGVYVWRRRLNPEKDNRVRTRELSFTLTLTIISITVVVAGGVGALLAHYTSDPTPYLDAFTTVVALVAQVLMILAYRNQWVMWFIVDIVSVAMWLYVGDYCMTAQYVFWCCNCIYGYLTWKKLE